MQNILKPRIHDATRCTTGCTTGCTTRKMSVYTIQPVVQPVASCIRSLNRQFFGLRFCRRQYESVCKQFDVVSFEMKCGTLSVITKNNGHHAVQGQGQSKLSFEISHTISY